MIAAAVAAISGIASAVDACAPGAAATPTYNATVYAVKFALKTPTGEVCSSKGTASACAPGQDATGYVRKPSTYALQGWFANCSRVCDILKNYTKNDIAIWNAKEQLFMKDITYTVSILHVLSKSQRDAEIKFNLVGTMNNQDDSSGLARKFTLDAAGFGKYDLKNNIYTSFAGNVVGTVSKVMYPKAVNTGTAAAPNWVCPEAGYWLCANVASGCAGVVKTEESVAYGTFSFTFNSAASTKMAQAKGLPVIPAYVTKPTAW